MKELAGKRRLQTLALGLSCVCFAAVGCGDDDDDDGAAAGKSGSSADDGGGGKAGGAGSAGRAGSGGRAGSSGSAGRAGSSGASGRGGAGGAGGSGASAEACDPSKKEVKVNEDISADTTWECGTYLLQKLVFVTGDSTLKIEPGVQVLGDTDQEGVVTALIVTRGSKLEAVGTKDEPIVFSSGNPEGARSPGDWGGVVLLGKATVNTGSCKEGQGEACEGGYFEGNIEGLDPTNPKSLYGGTDDDHECGHIQYARIEFAGFQLSMDNELNGLTLGGCGKNTKLSYIQVHRGSDDGIEFFGGTAGLDHVLITAPSDDGLDWDLGWRGNVQFLIVHQASNDGDKGIEADNLGANESATPRSKPTLYNVTLLGNPTKVGVLLREGTLGVLRNFIIDGFATAIDLNAIQVTLGDDWPANLSIESSVFFDNDAVGDADSMDDDKGFNEDEAIRSEDRKNVFDVDPEFESTDVTKPNYKPGSDKLGDKATPPSGFNAEAKYAGAVDPEGDDWTKGWTTAASN